MKNIGILLILALAIGMAFAANANEPILQISSYSTVPSDVYPGTLGYLQVTLTNTGTATAESVTARYNIDGSDASLSSGEISAGSSSQLSIPFKIRPEAAGSIQPVSVDVFYTFTSTSGVSNKKTSLSVPLMVLQQNPLEARTLSIDRSAIAPGEQLSLELELKNTGGVINSLVITLPANSSFSLEGTTQKSVGSIATNSSTKVPLVLLSSSSAEIGTYGIPVVFTYQDALRRPYEQTLYVGPVSVLEASTQYRLYLEPLTPAELGSQALFLLTLKNAGSAPVSAIVDINSTDIFTPIGMQRLYFDSVAPGSSFSRNITIGIAPSKSPGYYTLPLIVTSSTGQAAVFNAGVSVEATPEVTLSLDTQGDITQVQIANTGNSQIRSVYASARVAGSQATSESFIGTLNVDDFATLQLPSSSSGLLGSSPQIEVEIRFKDSNNIGHSINQTLEARGGVFSNQSSASRTGTGAAGAAGQRQAGPLGFLFGGGSRNSASQQGMGIVPIAVGVAVAAAAGFLVYKYYWKKRKAR